jgi:hypothetical protein
VRRERRSGREPTDQSDPWDRTEMMLAEIAEVVAKNRKIVARLHQQEDDR